MFYMNQNILDSATARAPANASTSGSRVPPAAVPKVGAASDPVASALEDATVPPPPNDPFSPQHTTTKRLSTMVDVANQDLNSIVATTSARLSKLAHLSKQLTDPEKIAESEAFLSAARKSVAAATNARNAVDAASTHVVALYVNANIIVNDINDALIAAEALLKEDTPNVASKSPLKQDTSDVASINSKALPPLPRKPVPSIFAGSPSSKAVKRRPSTPTLAEEIDVPLSPANSMMDDALRRNVRYGCGPTLRQTADARDIIMGTGDEASVIISSRLRVKQSISDMKNKVKKKVSSLFGGKN